VGNFAQFWREGREWGDGQADEAMLERGGEERIRGYWRSCGSTRSAHGSQPVMGQVKESAIRRRNWAHLMVKVGKGKEQSDTEMQKPEESVT
jgi:hypothetical protein